MFLPALPLPTGGVSHVFELMAVLVAAQTVLGTADDLAPGAESTESSAPRRPRRRSRSSSGGSVRSSGSPGRAACGCSTALVHADSRPRPDRVRGRSGARATVLGLDTLPALGAVIVALGIILEDVVVLAVGVAIGIGGIVLIVTIGAALVRLLRSLF